MTTEQNHSPLSHLKPQEQYWFLPILYLFGKIILFLGLIPKDHYGYGDFPVYFGWAELPGWPFFHFWVEYPPLFPFVNKSLYLVSGKQELLFDFLLTLIIIVAGAVSIYLFHKMSSILWGEYAGFTRTMVYFAILTCLPYTWWYFEPVPVLLMLLGLYALIQNKPNAAGGWLGLGTLAKWFPGFLLAAAWRFRSRISALRTSVIAISLTAVVILGLYITSPKFTAASLFSQPNRTSWETVWALIDHNYTTGAFVTIEDRLDPAIASIPRGEPAVISSRITLLFFVALGLYFFWRVNNFSDHSLIAFTGLTWMVFLVWSPGWSPQWILYLLPLILLSFPHEKAILWAFLLVLVAILEWPTSIPHGLLGGLFVTVILRTILFIVLMILWHRQTRLPRVTSGE